MTISLKKILHKNRFRIGIFFPSGAMENGLVKRMGALYSKTFRCWHLPYSRDCYIMIQETFKGYTIHAENKTASVPEETAPAFGLILPALERTVPEKRTGKKILPLSDINPKNVAAWLQMEQQLQLKGYSDSTQRTYKNEFLIYLKQLKQVAAEDIQEVRIKSYLQYCYTTLKLSENTIHSRMNALKFYYEQVLGREKFFYEIPRPKKHLQLPRVISEEKILEGLLAIQNIKHQTLLLTAYRGFAVCTIASRRKSDLSDERT